MNDDHLKAALEVAVRLYIEDFRDAYKREGFDDQWILAQGKQGQKLILERQPPPLNESRGLMK